MDVVVVETALGDRLHRFGLAFLLRGKAGAVEHVEEVRVPASVELIGPLDANTPLGEEVGQHPMDDRCAELSLDVVADDRDSALAEPLRPHRIAGDEYRDAI